MQKSQERAQKALIPDGYFDFDALDVAEAIYETQLNARTLAQKSQAAAPPRNDFTWMPTRRDVPDASGPRRHE